MNRIIVVTGSASGIGEACAYLVEKKGDRVIRVDRNGGDVICDLSNKEGREEMAAKVKEIAPGYIDGIITYAGLGVPEPVTLAVNFFGMVASIEGVKPLLDKSKAPRVVTSSSRSSLYAHDSIMVDLCLQGREKDALDIAATLAKIDYPDPLIYSSSKVAAARWTRRTAILPEWGGKGILMNCVNPGIVETPLTASVIANDSPIQQWVYDTHPQVIGHRQHTIQPHEIAGISVWLASEENTILVGQCIFADLGSEAILRGDGIW
jgi:NAD(P)-dependent dehydrogenase (short-subunit alcohol dehydrogenase family)